MNFQLRLAIQKAKEANLPNDRIEKSIKRGTGEGGGAKIDELTLDGYGPEGIAILIKAISDNRKRTVSDIRSILNKNGGRLSGSGSVEWVFESKGIITIILKDQPEGIDQNKIELAAIEAGAVDLDDSSDTLIVYTQPEKLVKIRQALEAQQIKIESAEISLEPKNTVKIDDPAVAKKIINIMEALEECEDVVSVSANFEIPDEMMEKVAEKEKL